jgi:hypothetical protein
MIVIARPDPVPASTATSSHNEALLLVGAWKIRNNPDVQILDRCSIIQTGSYCNVYGIQAHFKGLSSVEVKHIRHYVIHLKEPIPSVDWFLVAEAMERELNAKGFDTYEFRLVSKFDREWVVAHKELKFFEGHIGLPGSGRIDPEVLRLAMITFLVPRGIEIESIMLE